MTGMDLKGESNTVMNRYAPNLKDSGYNLNSSDPMDLLTNAVGDQTVFIFDQLESNEFGIKKLISQVRNPSGHTVLTIESLEQSQGQTGAPERVIFASLSGQTVLQAVILDDMISKLYCADVWLGTVRAKFGMMATCDVRATNEKGQPLMKVEQGKTVSADGALQYIVDEGTGNVMAKILDCFSFDNILQSASGQNLLAAAFSDELN